MENKHSSQSNPLHTATYAMLPDRLLGWYQQNARDLPWRRCSTPYHVWLSEIMLQQTRVEAVKSYYTRFLQALPTIEDLATVPDDKLLKLWEGLGYYNRARNLKKAAIEIMNSHGGQFPSEYEQIRNLPGIGDYTAGAIASICFGLPTPAVDGNVLRVMARIGENYAPIDQVQTKKAVTKILRQLYPMEQCGNFTQSLMELGATVCVPNGAPKCEVCPVSDICVARQNNTQALLPVKAPKRVRKIEQRTVLMLLCDDKVALRKRDNKGLLSGLWELPNQPGILSPQQALDTVVRLGAQPVELIKQVCRTHIFTHVEWHMTCYFIRCVAMPEKFVWKNRNALECEMALPTAFRMFFEAE